VKLIPIVYESDLPRCDCCGDEAYCPIHEMHFADCSCMGPGMASDLELEIITKNGKEYAVEP
jgi:hypothetical protein